MLIISKSKSLLGLFPGLLRRFFPICRSGCFALCLLDVLTWLTYSFLKYILSENWPQYPPSSDLTSLLTTQSPKILVSYLPLPFFSSLDLISQQFLLVLLKYILSLSPSFSSHGYYSGIGFEVLFLRTLK